MAEKRRLLSDLLEATVGVSPSARLTFRFGRRMLPIGVLQFHGVPDVGYSSFVSCELFRSIRIGPSRYWEDEIRRFEIAYLAPQRFGESPGAIPGYVASQMLEHDLEPSPGDVVLNAVQRGYDFPVTTPHAMLLPSFSWGDAFDDVWIGSSRVHVMQAVPITAREMEVVRRRGHLALVDRMWGGDGSDDAVNVNPSDVVRTIDFGVD